MSKIKISVFIFVLVIAFSAWSSRALNNITSFMSLQLMSIKASALDNDFVAAKKTYSELQRYYEDNKTLLEFLIKHDSVTNFSVNLSGIEAYLQYDNLADLNCEIDKTVEQVKRLDDVFSTVF